MKYYVLSGKAQDQAFWTSRFMMLSKGYAGYVVVASGSIGLAEPESESDEFPANVGSPAFAGPTIYNQ